MTRWTDLLLAPAPAAPVAAQFPPPLSVLVPAYNAADTVGEALESVLTQRPAPLEVIVSDDGSEDDLHRVLHGFGCRVRVVRGPHRGAPTARNRAASVARGDLFGLLDADDAWLPGRAEALLAAAAARPDLSILTTDAVVVRDGRREGATYYASRRFEVGDQEDAILRCNFVFGAGAIRAWAFRSVGGYDPEARWAEDWDLCLRLLLRGHRAGLVRAPLYEYRLRAGSQTTRTVDVALGSLAVLRNARTLATSPHRAAALARSEWEWAAWAARSSRLQGDPRRRRLLAEALRMPGVPAVERARLLAGDIRHSLLRSRR